MAPIRLVPAHEIPWRNAFLALFGALLAGTIAWPILFWVGIATNSGGLLLFTLVLGAGLTIAWSVVISPALLFARVLAYIPGAGRIVTGIGTASVFLVVSTTIAWAFDFAQKPSVLATYTVMTIIGALLLVLFGDDATFTWIRDFFFKRLAILWCLITLLGPAYMIIGDIPLAVRDRAKANAARTAANIRKGEIQQISYKTKGDLGKIQFFDSELLDGQTEPRPLVWKGCPDPTTGLVRLFYNGEGRVDGNCGKLLANTSPDDPELLAGIAAYQQKLADEAAQKATPEPITAEGGTPQDAVAATPSPPSTSTPEPTTEPMTAAQVLTQARELRERERKRQEEAYGAPTTTLPAWAHRAPTPTPTPAREPDYIKEGTELVVVLDNGVALTTSERIIPFSCVVRTEVRTTYGAVAIPKNSECLGRVSRIWENDGAMQAVLSVMEIADISLAPEQLAARISSKGQGAKKRAIIGGIIGGVVGGATGAIVDGERGARRGAAGGAVAGAAGGAATSRGPHIKRGTEITFTFWRDVSF